MCWKNESILVVFDVPIREGGRSHELSSKIWNESGWDSKWGDWRREKKTPNPNILLMVSLRRGPLAVKVLQSEKAIYCNKTRTKNRCCFFHQLEEGGLEQVLWLVPSHGLGNTVFFPRYPCLSESRCSPKVSAIILHHDSLQPMPVLLLCFKTRGKWIDSLTILKTHRLIVWGLLISLVWVDTHQLNLKLFVLAM